MQYVDVAIVRTWELQHKRIPSTRPSRFGQCIYNAYVLPG